MANKIASIHTMKKLYLLVSAVVMMQSCQNTPQNHGNSSENLPVEQNKIPANPLADKVHLVVSKQAKIYVGSQSLNYGFHLRVCTDKNRELLTMKSKTDSIRLIVIDWGQKKLIHAKAFPFDGPNGVGVMDEAFVISMDSIFVKSNNPTAVYLTNIKGNIKSKYIIPPSPKYYSLFEWIGYANGNLISTVWPEMDLGHNVQNLKSSAVFGEINIESKQFRAMTIQYPAFFSKEIKDWDEENQFIAKAEIVQGTLVYQFPAIDSLYVFDLKSQQQKAYYMRSRYKRTSPKPKRHATMQEVLYVTQHSTAYLNLLYDRYRKCYYRFVSHEVDSPYKHFSQLQITLAKPLSIQTINQQYEVIGETLLPTNKYFLFGAFVTKEGLWLSTSNPNNPENEEDYMTFDLLKIAKKE